MDTKLLNTTQILETLQEQRLTEEEKQRHHILKRLAGPIATYNDATRNGRLYNEALWNNQINDDILKEKIATKSLFLELGHPSDGREEIDMSKACACIPSMPKIVNGDLYGVIDVLDTPNGRILNTLIDYGFVPGISSRGTGEIMENDEVDPDSFCLETWDIVALPAVKKARLQVCESLNKSNKSLKSALTESYKDASEVDKEIMKETLDNLNISIEEDVDSDLEKFNNEEPVELSSLPQTFNGVKVRHMTIDQLLGESLTEDLDSEEFDDEEFDSEEAEEVEAEEDEAEVEEDEIYDATTVGEFLDQLENYDEDLMIEFSTINIDGKEYEVENLEFNDEDEKLVINMSYIPVEQEDNIEAEESEDEEETEVSDDAADDDGADEMMESFKEIVRQKDLLESKIKSLESEKTVSDAKVNELTEELNKYKFGFARTSKIAANVKKLKAENENLCEQLETNKKEIASLEAKVNSNISLNESVKSNVAKVNELTNLNESLNLKIESLEKNLDKTTKKLTEQIANANANVDKARNLAKSYKAKLSAVLNKYVESKAKMLGVKSAEITSRLNESYTLDDIDAICDNILTEKVNINRLPFNKPTKVTLRESKKPVNNQNNDILDVDDSLLELAGLK